MELLVTLRKKELYDSIKRLVDGIIVGKLFTSNFELSLEEIVALSKQVKKDNLKFYIVMDDFILENDKEMLFDYLDFISHLNVDGVYFHDLGVMEASKRFNLSSKLIYDGKTILTNSLETSFYLNSGIDGVVLSRELTYKEILNILKTNPGKIDMQIHGHIRMSYSKRHFLKNYFKEIDADFKQIENKQYVITEENRDYRMPITDDRSGTKIYSDFIFESYKEIPQLREYLKRGIVDTIFMEDAMIVKNLIDYKRIDKQNCAYMDELLQASEKNCFSSGYFYIKTNKTKDE